MCCISEVIILFRVFVLCSQMQILAAEAFEHRRLLDRLGPGNFVLHYEAARFLQNQPGPAGGGFFFLNDQATAGEYLSQPVELYR